MSQEVSWAEEARSCLKRWVELRRLGHVSRGELSRGGQINASRGELSWGARSCLKRLIELRSQIMSQEVSWAEEARSCLKMWVELRRLDHVSRDELSWGGQIKISRGELSWSGQIMSQEVSWAEEARSCLKRWVELRRPDHVSRCEWSWGDQIMSQEVSWAEEARSCLKRLIELRKPDHVSRRELSWGDQINVSSGELRWSVHNCVSLDVLSWTRVRLVSRTGSKHWSNCSAPWD